MTEQTVTKAEYRIGILSDTHGLLRPEVQEALQGCSAILHAGDIGGSEILEQLAAIAPVTAVRGNTDGAWAEELPASVQVTLGGVRFFMTHKPADVPEGLEDIDVIVCGHTHRYEEKTRRGRLFLNPGSCGKRRFGMPATMAVLTAAEDGSPRVRRIDLSVPAGRTSAGTQTSAREEELLKKDPAGLVRKVVAEVQRGRSIAQIAARLGISEELAESISRMYLTHPGVDVDGILRRIGR